MKKEYYRQVLCKTADGREEISWIPEQFAVKGKYLKFFVDNSKGWSNGWMVVEVYDRMAAEDLLKMERDYLKQRDVSDI